MIITFPKYINIKNSPTINKEKLPINIIIFNYGELNHKITTSSE